MTSAAAFVDIAHRAGFADVAVTAQAMRDFLGGIVSRTLAIAQQVPLACGGKATLTAAHFKLLARLDRELGHAAPGSASGQSGRNGAQAQAPAQAQSQSQSQRGGTGMPLRYFGAAPSPAYGAAADAGNHPWSDPQMARTALSASGPFAPPPGPSCAQGGGARGSTSLSDGLINALIKRYNESAQQRVRVSDDGKAELKAVTERTAVDALRAARPGGNSSNADGKRVTPTVLERARAKAHVRFA